MCWSSKKQATVAKSSTEVEYVALYIATQEAIWLRMLLSDLGLNTKTPIIIFEDNQGALELTKNPSHYKRTKHIDICHQFIRERISSKEIKVEYSPTERMITGIMALPKPTFEKFRTLLNVYLV